VADGLKQWFPATGYVLVHPIFLTVHQASFNYFICSKSVDIYLCWLFLWIFVSNTIIYI